MIYSVTTRGRLFCASRLRKHQTDMKRWHCYSSEQETKFIQSFYKAGKWLQKLGKAGEL